MSEKKTCFVIQPLDRKFKKRFDDVYEPAIKAAGLRPVRVDLDFAHDDFVEAIKQIISQSAICFADISLWKKPNVWYELGYAHAHGLSAVLVCEQGVRLPADISTKNVHFYQTESESDYRQLRKEITQSLKARPKKSVPPVPSSNDQEETLDAVEQAVLHYIIARSISKMPPVVDSTLRKEIPYAQASVGSALAKLKRENYIQQVKISHLNAPGHSPAYYPSDLGFRWIADHCTFSS